MRKLFYIISSCFLFYGCIFTYDPARGLLYVQNNSDEAVYVYFEYGDLDSLPLVSELELFTLIKSSMKDAYSIGGSRKKPNLPNNENEITLFFIPEKKMDYYGLKNIIKNQMFEKKITLSRKELETENWEYSYSP